MVEKKRRKKNLSFLIDRSLPSLPILPSPISHFPSHQDSRGLLVSRHGSQVQRAVSRAVADARAHALLQQPRDGLGISLRCRIAERRCARRHRIGSKKRHALALRGSRDAARGSVWERLWRVDGSGRKKKRDEFFFFFAK